MEAAMSRVQLALNVSNLDEAIDFYSKLFKSAPAKVRAGYANFAIDEPPLKLVLIENAKSAGSLNHLGIEVFSTTDVVDATSYFGAQGLSTRVEDETTCCYALQDKVWVDGVDGVSWEVYTVLSDSLTPDGAMKDDQCCALASADASSNSSVASCC
jgi:catechol 2,3-dioxygenase-like lactoylglutathione lyase family enzyme